MPPYASRNLPRVRLRQYALRLVDAERRFFAHEAAGSFIGSAVAGGVAKVDDPHLGLTGKAGSERAKDSYFSPGDLLPFEANPRGARALASSVVIAS